MPNKINLLSVERMASSGAGGYSTVTVPASKGLQRKWEERKLQEHRERVRTQQSSIAGPCVQPHPLAYFAAAEGQSDRGQRSTDRLHSPKAEPEKASGKAILTRIINKGKGEKANQPIVVMLD